MTATHDGAPAAAHDEGDRTTTNENRSHLTAPAPTADAIERGLAVARDLIGAGVPVFVAKSAHDETGAWDPKGGKGGTGYWLPTGWQTTPAAPSTLDTYEPGDALGMVCGHGIDALDFDPRNGGDDSHAQLAGAGLVPTVIGEAATPSGGSHLLVNSLGVRSRDGVRPGFDVKAGTDDGGRGFVFIAPTVKRSKVNGEIGAYSWTTEPNLDELDADDQSGAALAGVIDSVRAPRTIPARPATARGGEPGDGPDFADLDDEDQAAVRRYLDGALDGIAADNAPAADWPEDHTDERGRGWQKLAADAAHRLGALERAGWTPPDFDGRAELGKVIPAAIAAAVDLDDEWRRQSGRGTPAAYPQTLADSRTARRLGKATTATPATTTSSSQTTAAVVTDSRPSPPVMSLTEAHAVFTRWLGADYDLDALDVVLATAAVDRLDGDPLWLLVISGSGNAKTETVQALAGAGATLVSTISSEGALLSATSKKERSKHATGGLLRQLGDRGVLVVKDVTSILSMQRDQRAQVLGALREVYDGRWTRTVGTDGGQTLEWAGRIALVGAVTTAWDKAHAVIASMGDRFVLVRMDSTVHRAAAGRKAIGNTGHETQMRAELSSAAAGVLAGMSAEAVELTDDETDVLLAAADLVTLARTAVETDYRGDVIDAHAPEMPTRFAKQLAQVVRGSVAIGLGRDEGMRLAIRCARDSMPPLRLTLVDDVAAHPDSTTAEIRKRVGLPRATVDRGLQALDMLGVLEMDEEEGMHRGLPVTRWSYRLADGIEPDALNWHASSARNVSTHPQTPNKEGGGDGDEPSTPRTHTDISGTAPATAPGGRQRGPVPRVVAGRQARVNFETGQVLDAEAAS